MLKEFELGHEAIDYIRGQLSHGVSLSNLLLDLPLEKGRVTTILPAEVSIETVTQFEDGFWTEGFEENFDKRLYMADLSSTYLRDTKISSLRYAIFENSAERPTYPWLITRKAQFFTNDEHSDVYHFVTSKNNEIENITNAIRNAITAWLFTGILTEMVDGPDLVCGQAMDAGIMRTLAENTAYLFIGAYDGEGLLTWTRPGL